ncbi:hypothetical protein NL676_025759 [Syzygium grande]|nr:hypothetical protein NL676_025759 [Syzygium grande]
MPHQPLSRPPKSQTHVCATARAHSPLLIPLTIIVAGLRPLPLLLIADLASPPLPVDSMPSYYSPTPCRYRPPKPDHSLSPLLITDLNSTSRRCPMLLLPLHPTPSYCCCSLTPAYLNAKPPTLLFRDTQRPPVAAVAIACKVAYRRSSSPFAIPIRHELNQYL